MNETAQEIPKTEESAETKKETINKEADPKRILDFNAEAIYDEKFSPLMTQLIALSREHGIPMYATFAFESERNGERVGYVTTKINDIKDRYIEDIDRIHRSASRGAIRSDSSTGSLLGLLAALSR